MTLSSNEDFEPRRIGRSTREGMARSQFARIVRDKASSGLPPNVRTAESNRKFSSPQRVVVEVRVVRHRTSQRGRDSILRHVSYLSRESVSREPVGGRFYTAKENEIDA